MGEDGGEGGEDWVEGLEMRWVSGVEGSGGCEAGEEEVEVEGEGVELGEGEDEVGSGSEVGEGVSKEVNRSGGSWETER